MRFITFAFVSFAFSLSFPSLEGAAPYKPSSAELDKRTEAAKQRAAQDEAVKKSKERMADQKLLEERIRKLKEGQSAGLAASNAAVDFKPYTYPGVVVFGGDKWEGGDNIYNLPRGIAIAVDIVLPSAEDQTVPFPVHEDRIRQKVASIFQNAGIALYVPDAIVKPVLPLFVIVVIVQPIEKGYAFFCAANLLEAVELKRARIDTGVFQAITWERQHMIVSPTAEVTYHLERCVDDLAYSFVKLYRHFQNIPNTR